MFDSNSLNKLADAIPEELRDKLKGSAMEKFGLSKSEEVKNSEVAEAAHGEQAGQAPSEVNATDAATEDAVQQDAATDNETAEDLLMAHSSQPEPDAQAQTTDEEEEEDAA